MKLKMHALVTLVLLLALGCRNEVKEKVYKGPNEEYIQPNSLNFLQHECKDSSILAKYMFEQDIENNFRQNQFHLEPEVPFLKSLLKKENGLVMELSFVDDCMVKYLGDFNINADTIEIDYFLKTDSLGRVLSALCWCSYDLKFEITNLPYQTIDYQVFVREKSVESLLKLDDVHAKIQALVKE